MAIPTATTMTQTDSLVGAEIDEIEFSIGDPRWVMKTQADLYSNRELAVTREYSTNAFDANKQRALDEGTPIRPIEVTLPSVMHPFFRVRDYGYGMTRDILAEVYTKFGTSTKRDSNHFNGMLGYGSKSAVAYSTQFTVVSIANGIKTVAVVTRKPDWSIVMKIASQTKTDEESGTEITVPVHNSDEFRQKANDFYKFWLPGTVLVDGTAPDHAVGEKIDEGFYYSPSWNTSYVVMGNVPYRITNSSALFRDTHMNPFEFVAYVDNGDVEFTPSREDLKYTDLTKNTLHNIVKQFAAQILAKAKSDIDGAKTHLEAYQQWKKWTDNLGHGMFSALTFKGELFKSDFPVNAYRYKYGVRDGSRNVDRWNVESSANTLFVMEASMPTDNNVRPTPTTLMKYNAQQYKEIKGIGRTGQGSSTILFVRAADIDCKWIDKTGDNFITYEELAKLIPKKQRVSGGSYGAIKEMPGSFTVYSLDGTVEEHITAKHNASKKVFYIRTAVLRRENYKIREILRGMPKEAGKDIKVIEVPGNRFDKFRRTYPDINEFIPFAITKVVKDGASLLSQDTKDAKGIEWRTESILKKMDASKVDDPAIVRYIGLVKTTRDESEYDNNLNYARLLKQWSNVKTFDIKSVEVFKGYPLLKTLNYSQPIHEDTYLYLNAKYATTQKKGK